MEREFHVIGDDQTGKKNYKEKNPWSKGEINNEILIWWYECVVMISK